MGEDVRGPAPVCLCCRGVCGSRAWGAADAAFGAGKSGRVAADGHFAARPAAALPIPAEKLWELTGVQVGATTILSAILPQSAGVHLVMDRSVAEGEWFACTDGTATCFVKIRTADLLE